MNADLQSSQRGTQSARHAHNPRIEHKLANFLHRSTETKNVAKTCKSLTGNKSVSLSSLRARQPLQPGRKAQSYSAKPSTHKVTAPS